MKKLVLALLVVSSALYASEESSAAAAAGEGADRAGMLSAADAFKDACKMLKKEGEKGYEQTRYCARMLILNSPNGLPSKEADVSKEVFLRTCDPAMVAFLQAAGKLTDKSSSEAYSVVNVLLDQIAGRRPALKGKFDALDALAGLVALKEAEKEDSLGAAAAAAEQ